MADVIDMASAGAERYAGASQSPVRDELSRIMGLLHHACPPESYVSFTFDGRLQVHIDVRKREHVTLVQTALPRLNAGLFHSINIGGTPRHPFYHRVSALVEA
jgi:hypothetical protein